MAVLLPVALLLFPDALFVGAGFELLVLVKVAFAVAVDWSTDPVVATVDGIEVLSAALKLATVLVTEEDTKVAVLLGSSHGATTHCEASSLSTNLPFCSVGVRLRTYDELKLPAAQAMYPRKTSEFWLRKVF